MPRSARSASGLAMASPARRRKKVARSRCAMCSRKGASSASRCWPKRHFARCWPCRSCCSARIAEQLDLKEVLKLIVAKAVDLARVDRADIFRCSDDDRLELAATHGGGQSNRVIGFIAQAVREGRPLAVLNAYSDSRFPDLAQVAADEGFHSLFCMPLKVQQNRIIGGICLYTREARHFDYEQVRLLSTFADEAAIAIENARLYAESQRALMIKSAMLQEMHHRVRNNLQTISALLTMQQRRLDFDGNGAEALRDSVARIQA